jgi:nucleotidyltransferase substrate binding protein (TIGR01987 family)
MTQLRWEESYLALGNALDRFAEALTLESKYPVDIARDATIQRFEFTFELFWKTLKKIAQYKGSPANLPRDALAEAFRSQWIDDETAWMAMLADRNITSHVYRESDAEAIYAKLPAYYQLMREAYQRFPERIMDF